MDEGVFGIGKFPFGLMEDGQLIPKDLRAVFLSGQINRVPMIMGVNRDEFTWFQAMMELRTGRVVSEDAYTETVGATIDFLNKLHLNGFIVPADAIPAVLRLYPVEAYGNASRALAAVVGDAGIISTAGRRTTRVLASSCPQVYAYEFDVPDTPSPWPEVSFDYGSGHTLELPYIFPGFRGASGKNVALSKKQQKLAEEMVGYWTRFAWTGTPNGKADEGGKAEMVSSLPEWDVYGADKDNVMLFQAAEPIGMIEGWGKRHNSDFWDAFY